MSSDRRDSTPPSDAVSGAKERRRAKRSVLRLRANVTLPGDLTIESHTIDISLTGLSFDVPYELQIAQRCLVEVDLRRFGGRQFEVVASVRSCRAKPAGKFHAGLEFSEPPAEFSATLAKVLR